jgi:Tetracyclin repressor-like, C-terminal domain
MEANSIQEKYIDFVLRHGMPPQSVYVFAADNGMSEADFYKSYISFHAIEHGIWHELLTNNMARIQADETYAQYSVREKVLAFYYTLIEGLLAKRSFVTYTYKDVKFPKMIPSAIQHLKEPFKKWANELITEGIEKGEIIQRPILSERYVDGMWAQFLFIINFWLSDTSNQFERTDAAIEKAVNLNMDLMAHNPLDAAFDFAKFLIQKK